MDRCRKLEKYMESGRFGEGLTDLSMKWQIHMKECVDCRMFYEMITASEDILLDMEPVKLKANARARIRIGVLAAVKENIHRSIWNFWFKPVWGAATITIIIFLLLLIPQFKPKDMNNPINTGPEIFLAQMDEETRNEIWVSLESSYFNEDYYYESDQIVSELDAIQSGEEEMIGAAIDILSADLSSMYEDEILTSISELDEQDLEDLRRYLS